MKVAFQLAYKNLMGAGLRTWLNALVLSFSFVMIIFFNGMMDGWNEQAKSDTITWEIGSGQFWHEKYDPLDPFSLQDGHGEIPSNTNNLTPILIQQASIYPEDRMYPISLKGIDNQQVTLALPTKSLQKTSAQIPAIIGKRMAESTKLKKGDEVLLRWRDKNGTFDASKLKIVDIFDSNVPSVDNGQVWIDIEKLWQMTGMNNEATLLVADKNNSKQAIAGWNFNSPKMLLSDLEEVIAMKKYSSSFMYILLLAIALLAIFDTQVLSIFRRQKEIGTYIALGMTRPQVVGLFTVEGAMYSIFAMFLGCLYGIPLFVFMAKNGIEIPQASQDVGITIAARIFPVYGFQLIVTTILLVVISATIVSFLPSRKIAKMDPVAALKGKIY